MFVDLVNRGGAIEMAAILIIYLLSLDPSHYPKFEMEQSEPWFSSAFMCYAKIISSLCTFIFCFPNLAAHVSWLFYDQFVWQVAEWAYFCHYFLWNNYLQAVVIHGSFPERSDCIDKGIIFEQHRVCRPLSNLFITHVVTSDPKIL